MSSGEIRRLQQDILQRRASEINRFEPQNIDRIRLLQTQLLAGKVPVSKKLLKEQKKKKKKGRKTKNLRSDVARMMKEQRAAEKGETRDIRVRDERGRLKVVGQTEERRIIGDPVDGGAGSGVIPELEAEKIQRQERQQILDRRERVADRRQRLAIEDRRATDEANFRRLELQDRQRLAIEDRRERVAATLLGREQQIADRQARLAIEGLPQRPPPLEFTRVQREQAAALAQQQEEFQAENQYQRQFQARADARLRQLEDRFGQGDASLAENRARVEALEERERRRQEPLVRPADYDSVILDAVDTDRFRDDFERSAREGLGLDLFSASQTPVRASAQDRSALADEWTSQYTAKQEASSNRVDAGYIEAQRAEILGGGEGAPLTPEDRPGSGLRADLDNPSFYARPSPSQARPNTPELLTESAFDRSAAAAQEEVASALSTGLDLPSISPEPRGSPAALGPSAPSRLTSTAEAFPEFEPQPEPERLQQEDSVQPRILRGSPEAPDRFGEFAAEGDVSRSLQGQRRVPVGVEQEGAGQVEEESP